MENTAKETFSKKTEQFGNFLRKEAIRLDLTQVQFADKIGIAHSTLTAYIIGHNCPIDGKIWRQLTTACGWSQKEANSHWDKMIAEREGK